MEFTYLSNSLKIKRVSEDNKIGIFDIEGLYRGYGVTVGNAIRRVLLSSLPGAAITRFKIKTVLHEFTTIPGVLEDVVEIGLNLKKVRFRFEAENDEPQVLTLKFKGEGEVKAGDIETTLQARVQNPETHIATLTSKNAELDIEITVEKGLGYVTVESQKLDRLPIGVMALDTFFSPVVRVNFLVENMRVGERTDYNRIKLEIETDGSISPSRALHKASNILLDHFKKISDIDIMDEEPLAGVSHAKATAKKETKTKKVTKK